MVVRGLIPLVVIALSPLLHELTVATAEQRPALNDCRGCKSRQRTTRVSLASTHALTSPEDAERLSAHLEKLRPIAVDPNLDGIRMFDPQQPPKQIEDVLRFDLATLPTYAVVNKVMIPVNSNGMIIKTLDSIAVVGPNEEIIWPGAIIKSDEITSGILQTVAIARGPIKLSLENLMSETPETSFQTTVVAPTRANVYDAIHQLLHRKITSGTTARIIHSNHEFYSSEHAFLSAGISGGLFGSTVKANLSNDRYMMRHNIAVYLLQKYYTVHCEPPQSAAERFLPNSIPKPSESFDVFGNSMPVYVSSVTYGRALFFLFSSAEDRETLERSVNAHINFGIGNAGGDLKTKDETIIRESDLRVLMMGGPGKGIVEIVQSDRSKAFLDYLKSGENTSLTSGGAPIAHTLRYLNDNSLAKFQFTGSFGVIEPHTKTAEWTLTLIFVDDGKDKDSNLGADIKINNAVVATWISPENQEFKAGEVRDVKFQNVGKSIELSATQLPQLRLVFSAKGNDTCKFKYQLWRTDIDGRKHLVSHAWDHVIVMNESNPNPPFNPGNVFIAGEAEKP
jgi:hypothetical protein